ncbi:MAG: hypothetical protein HOO06_00790 [Bdellovibrionaceae bacterium]|mgnify:CR=1 FL=1|jgi:foldase protein PrsA|nr:hypothetical protein [Pseudobdellovibrionaceae bacterium]
MKYLFFITTAIFLTACNFSSEKIKDATVLQVNTSQLSVSDFSHRLASKLKQYDLITLKSGSYIKRAKDHIVREFIIDVLTDDWAKKKNIILTPNELNQEMEILLKQFPDEYAFRSTLLKEKIIYEDWKRNIRKLLLQKKVQNSLFKPHHMPSNAELKSFYKNNKKLFISPASIKVQQILLSTRADAELIRKKLKKGADFTKYAKKHSMGPEGPENGGILGWIPAGSTDVFEAYIYKPKGYTSGIIKSDFGYQIIKILDKKNKKQKKFIDSKEKITGILKRNKMQALYASWLEEQIRKTNIYQDEKLISKIKIETLGNQL